MKRINLAMILACSSTALHAGEIQWGMGDIEVSGGLFGINGTLTDSADTYTLKSEPKKLFSERGFYHYSINYYTPANLTQIGGEDVPFTNGYVQTPSIDFEWQGIDGQITTGYHILYQGPRDYLGIGVSLGIAAPWVKNTGVSMQDYTPIDIDFPTLPQLPGINQVADYIASTTDMFGYKVGPKVMASHSIGAHFSVFADISIATQQMNVSNDTFKFSTQLGGHYLSYGIGARYQLYKERFQAGRIDLEPQLYLTAGYKHAQLTMDEFAIDFMNIGLPLPETEMTFKANSYYLGIGYDF